MIAPALEKVMDVKLARSPFFFDHVDKGAADVIPSFRDHGLT
jgi:hypothetical protein